MQSLWKMPAGFLLAFMAVIFPLEVHTQPPDPPPGKVWVLNPEMSDEFDACSPGDKWIVYDKANSWNRTAAFDRRVPEVQRVLEDGKENYIIAMNPMWYPEEERFSKHGRTYFFAGGGMATHAMQTFGYFEVRIKPSDFPMGSGVFMNSREYTDGPCGVKYMTELDIIENMGYTGPGAGYWNNVMHVNTHVKPTDENCRGTAYLSTGGGLGKPLDRPLDFNVVGAWWKNKDSVDYYLNGEYFQTIEFIRDFYIPMPVILTMETYTWGGDDENNATNPKPLEYMFRDSFRTREIRAVCYDWVRSWQLVEIDTAKFNPDRDDIGFYNLPSRSGPDCVLELSILYSATGPRDIVVSLYDQASTRLAEETIPVGAGVGSVRSELRMDNMFPECSTCRVVCDIRPAGGDASTAKATDASSLILGKE